MKLGGSKTKLFCKTSFQIWKNETFLRDFLKNEVLKLKNEAFLWDFLQNCMKLWSSRTKLFCETSFNMKLGGSKTKLFCETSFKFETLKLKNETFLRDFLKNEALKLKNEAFLWDFSFQNDMLTRRLASEFQYVSAILAILKWMLQKCHEKVEPRHTNSCNCHAKWSLLSNTSVTWNLHPFHGFSARDFKHRFHKTPKSLRLPREKHHFGPSWNPPRMPTFLQASRTPAPATYFATSRNPCACRANSTSRAPGVLMILASKSLSRHSVVQILPRSTSTSAPNLSVFNDFGFQIILARRRGANFAKLNFQKCSEHAAWCLFSQKSLSRAGVVQILRSSTSKSAPSVRVLKILNTKSLSRAGVVLFCWHLGQPVLRNSRFSELTLRALGARKLKTQHFAQFLPAKSLMCCICAVKHLCRPTSMLQDLP